MNEKIFNSVLRDKLLSNISSMLEEISTPEFLHEVIDEYIEVTNDESVDVDVEVVEEKIKEKVFPLVILLQQFVVENLLPKNTHKTKL
jgi:hypothetical protein